MKRGEITTTFEKHAGMPVGPATGEATDCVSVPAGDIELPGGKEMKANAKKVNPTKGKKVPNRARYGKTKMSMRQVYDLHAVDGLTWGEITALTEIKSPWMKIAKFAKAEGLPYPVKVDLATKEHPKQVKNPVVDKSIEPDPPVEEVVDPLAIGNKDAVITADVDIPAKPARYELIDLNERTDIKRDSITQTHILVFEIAGKSIRLGLSGEPTEKYINRLIDIQESKALGLR